MKSVRPVIIFYFLLLGLKSQSQEFGGNPPSLQWSQIKIPAGRIIFPKNLEKQGERAALILDQLYRDTTGSIGSARKRINIVLQNQTTITNGYVALGPWRSEFLLTPSQNSFELGTLSSTDNLAIHEYRHVMQYSNYRKGLSRFMYYIAGEDGQALANAATIPNWFFEGDAVFNETALSGQGRGRIPAFFNGYRSLWSPKKNYSYMKLRNGSLKDYIPDHYPLGYMLVAYGRMKWGNSFWEKVTDDASRFEGLFYPFQKAVKRYSGLEFKNFVNESLSFYQKEESIKPSPEKFITPVQKNNVVDYQFPYGLGKDSLLVLKKSFRQIPAWWIITSAGETRIHTKSISIDDYYSYSNGRIVYSAYEPATRWNWKDYSVIRVLDLASGEERRVGGAQKYFSPDISPDGREIVAVKYDAAQICSLHILDASGGKLIRAIPNPSGLYYSHPKFFKTGELVAGARNQEGRTAMVLVDVNTGNVSNITPFGFEPSDFPSVKGDTILFTQSIGSFDVLMLYDHRSGRLWKTDPSYTGRYYPSLTGDGIITWSTFTAEGYRLTSSSIAELNWQEINTVPLQPEPLYLGSVLMQEGGPVLDKLPTKKFETKKYGKFTHPFNFHSWVPYYDNPEWSLTLYGENILNTLQSSLSYTYNQNEGSHALGYSAIYGAWYPWITGGVTETFHRSVVDSSGTITWNEGNANLGLTLPLNFTRGRLYKFLTLSTSLNGLQQNITQPKGKYENTQFLYLQTVFNFSAQVQQAVQHIYPRLGWAIHLQNRNSISSLTAQQFMASGSLYLPGLALNHNLVLTGSYQRRDTARQYLFTNDFPFSRGYEAIDAPRLWRWSVNYHFPLWYPDWGFGQIVYFLRVRANVFYDNGAAKSLRTGQVFDFRTVGGELYFDTKWWNQQVLSFGFRYSRLLDPNLASASSNSNILEFILPVIPIR